MKNTTLPILSIAVCALGPIAVAQDKPTAVTAPDATSAPTPAPVSEQELREAVSYSLGFGVAQMLRSQLPLESGDINDAAFLRGLHDCLDEKENPDMQAKAANPALVAAFRERMEMRREKIANENKTKGEAFLAENAKKEGVRTTKSGLQYKVLIEGKGETYDTKKHGDDSVIMAEYEGRLIDGTVFDRSEGPVPFHPQTIIPGIEEALKMMPMGSEWEVYVPSDLAYGKDAPAELGPNQVLIFKLKVSEITKLPQPSAPELTPEQIKQLREGGMQPEGQLKEGNSQPAEQ